MVKAATDKKRTAKKKTAAKKKTTQPAVPKVSRTIKPDNMELEEWQRLLRKQFGEQQPFGLENVGDHPLFSDFSLTNPLSGKSYRIAIRGERDGENYCSCPDYRINNLGTCKHIEFRCGRNVGRKSSSGPVMSLPIPRFILPMASGAKSDFGPDRTLRPDS